MSSGFKGVAFPLTPTLSLGERGSRRLIGVLCCPGCWLIEEGARGEEEAVKAAGPGFEFVVFGIAVGIELGELNSFLIGLLFNVSGDP